jgi:hypothetical protein
MPSTKQGPINSKKGPVDLILEEKGAGSWSHDKWRFRTSNDANDTSMLCLRMNDPEKSGLREAKLNGYLTMKNMHGFRHSQIII